MAATKAAAVQDRPLPHSLDAEKAAIGAAMVSEQAWRELVGSVTPAEFYRAAHRTIMDAISAVFDRGAVADLVTVRDELQRRGALDECGGPAYLASLVDGVPRSSNAPHYGAIVREKARLRRAIEIASGMTSMCYEEAGDAASLVDGCVRSLLDAMPPSRGGTVTAQQAMQDYVQTLDSPPSFVPTGYADVDELIGGLVPGDLAIVAARPSVGKTSFALGAARHLALAGGTALFFSLEMSQQQVAAKVLAYGSHVSTSRMDMRAMKESDYPKIAAVLGNDEHARLVIDDQARTLTEIAAVCDREASVRGQLSAVFVDYLQLMTTAGRVESRHVEVAAFSRGLKRLARDLKAPVVALSQLSRAPEARADKRPHMADLRESGSLEQDADLILLLFREEMHRPSAEVEGIAEAIVAKNRTGPVGVVRLVFLKELSMFADFAYGS